MSRIALEVSTVQLVSNDYAVRGLQNEKYIYLDFAWILRGRGWSVGWVVVGLTAVVLVARPFILPVRVCEAVLGRVAEF